MAYYLRDIPLETAWARLNDALRAAGYAGVLATEAIPLDEAALGRTLAAPVWARLSSPHYHASAMDGFAVVAARTAGAMLTAPVTLPLTGPEPVAAYVDTGDPLPGWANAVIPIEDVEPLDGTGAVAGDPRQPAAIRIRAAVAPWKHIRPLGEDMVATQLVLPGGHALRPVDLGAVAGSGHATVTVARRPRVAIIPTGSELKPIGTPVARGDIVEYNSLVLAAQVREWGGAPTRWAIVPDERAALIAAVREAVVDHDLILLNAGSSAGSEDYSADVVDALGERLVHGIAVRPGHPVILGMVRRDEAAAAAAARPTVPIIGVPGYPVSAALTAEIFVRPLLARWLGRPVATPETVEATLTRKMASPAGDDDYVRMAVGRVGERLVAAPLTRGAGVISSLVRADGLAIVPAGSQGLPAGAPVTVRLLRPRHEIDRTILAIGSHDLTLDLLAQYLAQRERRLASANAGSLGGLVALRRDEAHLAGSHLLDPATGETNIPYIARYLPGRPVRVVTLVGRQQGLLVPAGNPRGIRTLADLARADVRFVNRQRGAGTRVLLDYHLAQAGLAAADVNGYEQEEYTHLAVAAAVASGRADCGLGIAAAAEALRLDFVPLFSERYDLVIPDEYARAPLLAPLFEVLADPKFRADVARLPGYDISAMGTVIHDGVVTR